MFSDFDFKVIYHSCYYLFSVGMKFTLILTLFAMVGGIILGTLLAMMRLSKNKLISLFAIGYINLFRSTPLVLVIFWFYFLVPYIGAWIINAKEPIEIGAFYSALITFVLFQAAYYSEIMRSGIQSVPRGQTSAAYALGMNYWQMFAHIILPQAFRNMIPILLSQTITLFQDISLVYVLGSVPDFVSVASKVAQRDGRMVEIYLFVALVYFLMSFGLSSLVKKCYHH